MRRAIILLAAVSIFAGFQGRSLAQESPSSERIPTWLKLQSIPSLTLVSTLERNAFGFEWELAPLLYSFGLTDLVSPWFVFIVEPPARFSGSIELVVSGQVFTKKARTSYFSGAVELLGHIPLIERGEHLALTIGIAKYTFAESASLFKVIGVSTLFGLVDLNLKHSSAPTTWVGSLEFRFF